jgi:hypothetical protein
MSEETKEKTQFEVKQWVDWIGGASVFETPKNTWEWSFHKSFQMRVQSQHAPSFLHRTMQKWFLGIYWRKVTNE